MTSSNWYTFKSASVKSNKCPTYFYTQYKRNPSYFKEGTYKKDGRIWLISDEGIEHVLKSVKKEGVHLRNKLLKWTTKQKWKFCFYPQTLILATFQEKKRLTF